jgi:uncharacterized protein (TIGR03000 family)
MYSVVLMTVLTAGGGEATSFGRHRGHGCHGCHACHGCHGAFGVSFGCSGCWGCHGCSGYVSSCWGCHGCWGSSCYGCWGSSCHGCWGCHGCHTPTVIYSSCHGCHGCHGSYAPVYMAPARDVEVRRIVIESKDPRVIKVDGSTAPRTMEEEEAVRRLLRELRDKKPFVPPTPKGEAGKAPASVTVRLPADAKLWVDDTLCPLTSGLRSFNTPELQGGRQYYYTLRMEVEREGQVLSLSRRVLISAGSTVSVDLNDLSTATVSR